MNKLVLRTQQFAGPAATPGVVSCALTDAAWDAFVMTQPAGTYAHRLGFGRVLAEVLQYKPHYLALRRGGEIQGVLPLFLVPRGLRGRALVSLPCSDWGGVVCRDEESEVILLKAAVQLAQEVRADFLEIRSRHHLPVGPPADLVKVNLRLRLATPSEIWCRMRAETRNQVRKAERGGLRFEVRGAEAIPEFFKVWSTNMRDLGTPAYPKYFFGRLLAELTGDSGVFLVRHGSRAIGGGIFTVSHGEMTVPFASSLRSEFHRCPNNLLYWGAIQEACKRGLTRFSFGRSSRGSGTYWFKKAWGAEEEQLYNQVVAITGHGRPPDPSALFFRLAIMVWKRIPVPVANILGPLLARRFVP